MFVRKQKARVEVFVARLAEAQFALHAYLSYLVGNTHDAYDVLQETNLILWQKAGAYEADKPFLNWARTIAFYQALKFRKTQSRERLVFDDDVLRQVAAYAECGEENEHHRLLDRMEECFGRLAPEQRAVMLAKYQEGATLAELGARLGCSSAAAGMLLMRIRKVLARCVREPRLSEATP